MTAYDQNEKPGANTKSRFFLFTGILAMLLMAGLSGLDASLVYIFLGIAAYAFFMAYWMHPGRLTSQQIQDSEIFADVKSIFQPKAKPYQYKKPQHQQTNATKSKIALIIFAFVFVLFFSIVFLAIVFVDDVEPDSSFYYQVGQTLKDNGQNDSAKFYFRKALAENEFDEQTLFSYGNIFLDEANYDSAIVYYTRVLDINAEFDDARFNKSLAKYYLRNYADSRKDAFEILEINPTYDNATLMIGDTYYAESRFDSAIFWYEGAYERGIRTAALCHVMAYVYDERSETDKAIQFYQESLSYDSANVEIYKRLSELLPNESATYQRLYQRYQ